MTQKKGRLRKRRLKRLPIATAGGKAAFEPTPNDWTRIEAAYGRALSEADRNEVIEIVRSYFYWEPFERNAPFVHDAEEWLERVSASANSFFSTLFAEQEKREASSAPKTLIEQHFQTRFLPHEGRLRNFTSLMREFVTACSIAKKKFPEYAAGGFEEGRAWNLLIRNLTKFGKERGMPTAASKGSDKSGSARPSPFVAFVRELQRTFPEDCRRHDPSDGALARGIRFRHETRKPSRRFHHETTYSLPGG